MWNLFWNFELLFSSISFLLWTLPCCRPAQDLRYREVTVDVDSLSMALRYTAHQLLILNRNFYLANDIYELMRPKHYIYHSERLSFIHLSSTAISVPIFWHKAERGFCTGVHLSALPWSKFSLVSLSPVKAVLFNACSVNSKSLLLPDIFTEKIPGPRVFNRNIGQTERWTHL